MEDNVALAFDALVVAVDGAHLANVVLEVDTEELEVNVLCVHGVGPLHISGVVDLVVVGSSLLDVSRVEGGAMRIVLPS